MRRLFTGRLISIQSTLVTAVFTLLVALCVISVEGRLSAGWIGNYKMGFPFVYSSGGAASTPIPDYRTGELISQDVSGYYSKQKFWENWIVYFVTGLILNVYFKYGIFSNHKPTALFSRYFLALGFTLAWLPFWIGDVGLPGAGLPFVFFEQQKYREYSTAVNFNPSLMVIDIGLYLLIASGLTYLHKRLIQNRK